MSLWKASRGRDGTGRVRQDDQRTVTVTVSVTVGTTVGLLPPELETTDGFQVSRCDLTSSAQRLKDARSTVVKTVNALTHICRAFTECSTTHLNAERLLLSICQQPPAAKY